LHSLSRRRASAFTDRPVQFTADLNIDDQEIAESRSARLKLAGRIEHINATLPSIHDLPEGTAIARLHENLIEAGDWREAWDWAASQAYLQRIDQRDHLRSLSDERVQLDHGIAKTFERLVR
jgi:hypothetical protein